MAKGATEEALRSLGLEPFREGAAPGWLFAAGDGVDVDLDALVQRAASRGAALGTVVFDSDIAYVAAANAAGSVAGIVIGREAARESGLEVPPDDVDGFAGWSSSAPIAIDGDSIRSVLARDWVFAEQGVDELCELVGLPRPYDEVSETGADGARRASTASIGADGLAGFRSPLPSMGESLYIGGSELPWRDVRFVPGAGADFLGIWDRDAPAEPVARFPASPRGEDRLREELDGLHTPLLLGLLGLGNLVGLLRPLEQGATVRLAQRELPQRLARFVAGEGDGYFGVWDRQAPGRPVERFPRNDTGSRLAWRRGHELLLEHELGRRRVSGRRWFVPRAEPRIVAQELSVLDGIDLPDELREQYEEMARLGSYRMTPAGPWLLTVEAEADWPATIAIAPRGEFFLYAFHDLGDVALGAGAHPPPELGLLCEGSFETLDSARDAARRLDLDGEWLAVPDDVPRTLLATVRWVVQQ